MRAEEPVAIGVAAEDGRIWIQKREKRGPLEGFWEFPGGRIEPGESPRQALIRELQEETGSAPVEDSIRLLQVRVFNDRPCRLRLYFFLCRLAGPPATPGRWLPAWQLLHTRMPPANREIIDQLQSRSVSGRNG